MFNYTRCEPETWFMEELSQSKESVFFKRLIASRTFLCKIQILISSIRLRDDLSLDDSITFVGRLVSLARLARLLVTRVWLRLLLMGLDLEAGLDDVMGLGLSSSGLSEDMDDPVDDPRACLDKPDIGLLLSETFILSILRLSEETLDLFEAFEKYKFSIKYQHCWLFYSLWLVCSWLVGCFIW